MVLLEIAPLFLLVVVASASTGGIKGVTEPRCFEVPPASLPGPCDNYVPDVYFDRSLNKCVQYMYGGCGEGGLGFGSIDECQQHCGAIAAMFASEGKFKSKNSQCNLPAVTGPCKAYFPSYYYDIETGECHEFVYGGCLGNTNRFQALPDCQKTCL